MEIPAGPAGTSEAARPRAAAASVFFSPSKTCSGPARCNRASCGNGHAGAKADVFANRPHNSGQASQGWIAAAAQHSME